MNAKQFSPSLAPGGAPLIHIMESKTSHLDEKHISDDIREESCTEDTME